MNSIKREIARRDLFKYLGNSIVFLPFMRTLMETEAFGQNARKVALFYYYPDGIVNYPLGKGGVLNTFHPMQTGSTFTLPAMTAPLERVKKDIIILKNTNYDTSNSHEGGINYALTGANASSVSLDHVLGQKFIAATPCLRLGIGSQYEGGGTAKAASFRSDSGAAVPNEITDNPTKAFLDVFGGSTTPGPGPTPGTPVVPTSGLTLSAKKSLLDNNLQQLKGLQSKLGTIEKNKLDLHVEAIRELERRLALMENPGGGGGGETSQQCTRKINERKKFSLNDNNYPKEFWKAEHFNDVLDMQMEIAIQALACGLTNVAYIQNSHSVSNTQFANGKPMAGGGDHHNASHHGGSANEIHTLNQTYFMEKFAKLIEGMGAIKVGDKSLLYNSSMMAFSEIGDGDRHSFVNMGTILAGQGGGYFKTGQCVDGEGAAHNAVLVAIARAMGHSIDTFGKTTMYNYGKLLEKVRA